MCVQWEPRLRWLLYAIFALFALLAANSVYLGSITFLEYLEGRSQRHLPELLLHGDVRNASRAGAALILPVVIFGILHIRNAHNRPNRRAVRVGYLLWGTSLAILFTGIALMRFDFFQHQESQPAFPDLLGARRHAGGGDLVVCAASNGWSAHQMEDWNPLGGGGWGWRSWARLLLHSSHPRKNQIGSKEGEKYFEPSLARTASGNFIRPAR
jgi:hypothetical protein